MENIAIIILAAGASSRFGSPKQNIVWKGKTLLQNAYDAATGISDRPVIIVGANAPEIFLGFNNRADVLVNDQWKEGMASGIRLGIKHVQTLRPDSIILAVCDQPYLSSEILQSLVSASKLSAKKIIASKYGDTAGVPVLFKKFYFEELLKLKGDHGAKNIIRRHSEDVDTVRFEKGATDIDTPADFKALSL